MGVVDPLCVLIKCCLCCSFLLTLYVCSSMGFFPWQSVLHNLLQHESFSLLGAAVLHKLLEHVSLPCGAVFQDHAAPAWVPLQGHKCCQKTCSSVGSCLHEVSSAGFPWCHSLLWVSTCSITGCRWDLCSTARLPQAAGTQFPHPGLHHKLQGNLSSSA